MGQGIKMSAARKTDRFPLGERAVHASSNGRRSQYAGYQHAGNHRTGSGHSHPKAYALPIRGFKASKIL